MQEKFLGDDDDINTYVTLEYPHIGKGSYGIVYKATIDIDITSPSKGLIKKGTTVIVKEQTIKNDRTRKRMQDEIIILYNAMKDGCANIVQLYDVFATAEKMYFIMEYIEGSDLHTLYIKNKLPFNTEDELISNILQPLINGLKCLHKHNIAHRDIKLENIMYDKKNNTYKWIDFGLSCRLKCSQGPVGNYSTMAPEVLLKETFKPTIANWIKTDIWSFGCTVYKILERKSYYTQNLLSDLYNEKKFNSIKERIKSYRFKQSDIATEKYPRIAALLENCLQIIPQKRSLSFENNENNENKENNNSDTIDKTKSLNKTLSLSYTK